MLLRQVEVVCWLVFPFGVSGKWVRVVSMHDCTDGEAKLQPWSPTALQRRSPRHFNLKVGISPSKFVCGFDIDQAGSSGRQTEITRSVSLTSARLVGVVDEQEVSKVRLIPRTSWQSRKTHTVTTKASIVFSSSLPQSQNMPALRPTRKRKTSSIEPLDRCTVYELHHIRGHEIRILVLQPAAEQNSPLKCSLATRSLSSSSVPYEALSYTWGPPLDGWIHEDEELELCGWLTTIKSNLASALRQFRHTRRCRRLWVDALCINQSDSTERSQQVQLMAHIYAKAFRVLIWLGKDDEICTGAIAMSFSRAVYKRPILFTPPSKVRKIYGRNGLMNPNRI